uniref:Uncharacterized protein n=1 Tax=Arundo donax TaxID=35708 RepID=A0A0A9HFX8_ARUDO
MLQRPSPPPAPEGGEVSRRREAAAARRTWRRAWRGWSRRRGRRPAS